MSAKVFILLPVHNRRAITEKFVDCLAAQSYSNYHLVLIDDGSNDGTSEMVKGRITNLTVITGKGDWWWAGSLQQGINWLKMNAADEDIALFINDDVTFAPDFLQNGVCLLDTHGGMVLPQVLNEETGTIEESGVEANLKKLTFRTATTPERINCLPTRGLFMRMSVLRKVGGFFPKLLPHYLSDYEFTIRAYRLGIPLTTTPKLTIRFDREATGYRAFDGMSFTDFLRTYFSIKSALNPIYWSTFVLLASPKIYIPLLLTRVWTRSIVLIFRQIFRLVTGKGATA